LSAARVTRRHLSFLTNDRFRHQLASICLITVFAIVSIQRLALSLADNTLWIDLYIYREAAIAWLTGGDPYAVAVHGFTFAGTPPALLAFIPAALMPVWIAIPIYAGVFALGWLATVRLLQLPIWWLLFPPATEAVFVLNPDALLVLLLLYGGPLAGTAIMLKSYAAIPAALQGRWGTLAVGAALSLITLPLWIGYIQRGQELNVALQQQANGGLSAWGTWLVIPTIVALVAIRGRGASWLIVPALWPYTQLHYAAIAVPYARKSPLVAFLLSFANPLFPAFAVMLEAARVQLWPRLASRLEGRSRR